MVNHAPAPGGPSLHPEPVDLSRTANFARTLRGSGRSHFPDLDLLLVDGNGILHPRGGGVAACFGVVADVPTVGVAKSLLCGRVEVDAPAIEGCPPVSVEGKIVGAAYQRGPAAHRLYISPGQRIDVAGAVRIARLLDFGHRLPEPLFWADRLSRAEARQLAKGSLL